MSTDREPQAPTPRVLDVLLVAAWFALLSGFAEVGRLALGRFALDQYVHRSLHAVWMAPLAHLILFAVPALVLVAIAVARRGRVPLGATVFVFGALAALAVLLGIPRVSKWAVVALALGLATQAVRVVRKRETAFLGLVRRTTPALVALLVLACAGGLGGAWWLERSTVAALPAAQQGTPNVLLVVMDTVRAQNMSVYGYERETTPELERLAARGIAFDRAYSTAPWTLPSHASMFTGKYHHELSVGWFEPLDGADPTLAETLAGRGYATGGFVANTLYCGEQSGLGRGFARYEDYPTNSIGEVVYNSTLGREIIALPWPASVKNVLYFVHRKRAADVNDEFLSWVDGADGRPFFAFLNYMDAHEPYLPPAPFAFQFAEKRPANAFVDDEGRYTPEEIATLMAAYDGGIAYVDHEIGRLLGDLDRRGLLANTLVVVTSDHGEEFGEHGYVSHSNSLHVQGIHVPLVLALPGGEAAGKRVVEPVTLRDLPATVLDVVGGTTVGALPGESLVRHWRGPGGPGSSPVLSEVNRAPNVASWLPVSVGDLKSIVADKYHFIRNGDGQELLYDLERDPFETTDRAAVTELGEVFREMRSALDVATSRDGVARAAGGRRTSRARARPR
jgi:arylsulfatase A-like enzyme